MKIWSIAVNTYREAIRDRALAVAGVFVVIVIACALIAGYMAVGQERKILLDVGLSAMSILGLIVAVFLGLGLIKKEIDRRTLSFLLSKPVRRYELILGKFLGLAATLFVLSLLMVLSLTVAEILVAGNVSSGSFSFWPAAWLLYLELLIVTAVAMFFAGFSTPALSAALTLLIFLIGRSSMELKWWAETAGAPAVRGVFRILYYLLPNLANFNYIAEAAHGEAIPLNPILGASLYGFFYLLVLLLATVLVFERRDLP